MEAANNGFDTLWAVFCLSREAENDCGFNRSGYYKWRSRKPSETELRRLDAERQLINLFTRFKSRYGSPRLTIELNETGTPISENTVAKPMAKQGLMARNGKGYKYFPDVLARNHVSDNLLQRNFQASKLMKSGCRTLPTSKSRKVLFTLRLSWTCFRARSLVAHSALR